MRRQNHSRYHDEFISLSGGAYRASPGIFEFIALHPRNLTDICTQANVERRPAETLVMALLALKLIDRDGETFSLTPEAETFLLKNNPHYFGYFWDLMIENSEIFSLKNTENAIRKNTSQAYGEQELFETHTLDADRMRRFTHAMHSLSMGSASVWPALLPLGACRAALDIGGASGAHAISGGPLADVDLHRVRSAGGVPARRRLRAPLRSQPAHRHPQRRYVARSLPGCGSAPVLQYFPRLADGQEPLLAQRAMRPSRPGAGS